MKKKAVLYIDTSDNNKTSIFLGVDNKKKKLVQKTDSWTSQVLLPLIEKMLRENKLSIADISEIKVNVGPGSFTGVRIGVAVANILGYLLDIPVNGKKPHIVEPVYQHSLDCKNSDFRTQPMSLRGEIPRFHSGQAPQSRCNVLKPYGIATPDGSR